MVHLRSDVSALVFIRTSENEEMKKKKWSRRLRGNEQMTRLKLIYIQRNKSKRQKEHISSPKSSAKYEPGLILGLRWKMEFQQSITSTQNVTTTLQNAFSSNVCCYSPTSSLMPAVTLNVMRTLLRPRGSMNKLSSRIYHPYIDLDTCMPRFKPFLLQSVITIVLIFSLAFERQPASSHTIWAVLQDSVSW